MSTKVTGIMLAKDLRPGDQFILVFDLPQWSDTHHMPHSRLGYHNPLGLIEAENSGAWPIHTLLRQDQSHSGPGEPGVWARINRVEVHVAPDAVVLRVEEHKITQTTWVPV